MVYIVNTTHISLERMWHGWSWCERLLYSSFGAAKMIENHSVLCYLMMVRISHTSVALGWMIGELVGRAKVGTWYSSSVVGKSVTWYYQLKMALSP